MAFHLGGERDHHIAPEIEAIAAKVVDAAYAVHDSIGPGHRESLYHRCFAIALQNRGLVFRHEANIPFVFEDVLVEDGARPDFIVEDQIVVEIKASDAMLPHFRSQTASYLRLSGLPIGFLLNFNVASFRAGIRRQVWTPRRIPPGDR